MLSPLVVLVGLIATQPAQIDLKERVPIALVVTAPTGSASSVSRSDLIRAAGDLLTRKTDFFPQELDAIDVEDCKGRLTCLAMKARRDYSKDAKNREFLPRSDSKPEYLLFISTVSISDMEDRLSITLLDLVSALRTHYEAKPRPGWNDEVEATVSEQALVGPSTRGPIRDVQEAEALLEGVFLENYANPLGAVGHWEPYGNIEIRAGTEGATIRLDGAAIGVTSPGKTTVVGVRPGTRKLEVVQRGFTPYEADVDVTPKATATVQITLTAEASNSPAMLRAVTLWSGVAIAVGGVVLAGVAASMGSNVETSCFGDCSTGSEFVTFGFNPQAPSGVAIAPLGFALFGAGAGFAFGAWLIGEPDEVPWIAWLIGAAVGGATYAVSVLADHSTPGVTQ